MKCVVVAIIAISLCACKSGDWKPEIKPSIEVETKAAEIAIERVIEPIKSGAHFENIMASINGVKIEGQPLSIQGGYIYQTVDKLKAFQDYEFNVRINYRYEILMQINLDDYCVMGSYWRGKWLFTDNLLECDDYLSNPPHLNMEDFTAIYGDMKVKEGKNFRAYLPRDYQFSGEWLITSL